MLRERIRQMINCVSMTPKLLTSQRSWYVRYSNTNADNVE